MSSNAQGQKFLLNNSKYLSNLINDVSSNDIYKPYKDILSSIEGSIQKYNYVDAITNPPNQKSDQIELFLLYLLIITTYFLLFFIKNNNDNSEIIINTIEKNKLIIDYIINLIKDNRRNDIAIINDIKVVLN